MTSLKKILVIGLDQAGKTSILNILKQKYNLMDNIKPTAGIERDEFNILGVPILSWDLGGQQKFRQGYLKDFKIFAETDALYFVVDLLNPKRYEEALQYYGDVLDICKKLDLRPRIVLCIHKADPNIRNSLNTQEIIKNLKDDFLARSRGYEIKIYVTSIYDRKTIAEAFSKTLQKLIVSLKVFNKILTSMLRQLNLDALLLFDEKMLILNELYKDVEIEQVCLNMVYNSVYYMSVTNPQLVDAHFAKNFEFILNLRNKEKRFNFMEVKYKEWILFLLTMSDEKLDTNRIIELFNSKVRNLDIGG
ncbi:MAG: ADP-ribosylation factor-like protein [Candidatus Helarchaeota archaeon]